MADAATLEMLIKIREDIAGLDRARAGLGAVKKEAAGVNKEMGQMDQFGKKMGGLFGQFTAANLAANAITYLTRSLSTGVAAMINYGDTVRNQARNLDMSIQGYQVYRKLIIDTGGSLDALKGALSTQAQAMVDAREGIGPAAAAYRELNLEVEQLADLSRERQLEAVARAIAKSHDKQAAWRNAMKLLGTDTVPQLRGALEKLAENGYDKLTDSMLRNGEVMSDSTVARLNKAKLAWQDMFHWLTIQTAELGSAITDPYGEGVLWLAQKFNPELTKLLNPGPQAKPADPEIAADIARRKALRAANYDAQSRTLSREIIEQDPLRSESDKRDSLLGAIEREITARSKLVDVMREQKLGVNESAEDRAMQLERENAEITKLNQRLWAMKLPKSARARIGEAYTAINDPLRNPDYLTDSQGVSAGAMNFLTKLGSTGQQTAAILENSLGAALSSIGADIWSAMKGTQAWSQVWTNLGDIAGRMLTQIIAQMIVLKTLNLALGLFGYGISGNTGPTISKVAAAGGGSFFTNGPTSFTVGDNPGGIEHVQVTPISGLGQTTINGRNIAMAGGGSALVNGSRGSSGAGDTFHFAYTFAGGVSRAEVMGMLPTLIEASKGAVLEAKRRGRDGF